MSEPYRPPYQPAYRPSRGWEIMWFSFAAVLPISAATAQVVRARYDPSVTWVVPLVMSYCAIRGIWARRRRLRR